MCQFSRFDIYFLWEKPACPRLVVVLWRSFWHWYHTFALNGSQHIFSRFKIFKFKKKVFFGTLVIWHLNRKRVTSGPQFFFSFMLKAVILKQSWKLLLEGNTYFPEEGRKEKRRWNWKKKIFSIFSIEGNFSSSSDA